MAPVLDRGDASALDRRALLTVADEIHLKSKRTRRRFVRILRENIASALDRAGLRADVIDAPSGRMTAIPRDPADLERLAAVLAAVFGIHRVDVVRRVAIADLDELCAAATDLFAPRVAGRRFAVRVRRRGQHEWHTGDAERAIGSLLLPSSAGVDLDHPDITAHVEVWDGDAYLVERRTAGAGGLPLGTQPAVLSLLSGGFDSPVAAWLLMRRGSPVDFVHVTMDCAQSDHALAVAFELWRRWGAGSDPTVWVVEFRDVKDALLRCVDDAHRQVVLKQLMFRTAATLARRHGHPALVTGESVGQVSTQTVANLAEIDRAHDATVLRPLAGFTKDEIVAWSRRIGTHDLSARAREVCNLSVGPVETAARRGRLLRAAAGLPPELVDRALARTVRVRLASWQPGMDLASGGAASAAALKAPAAPRA
jgi:thiamine biosynthesis protein ThiI